MNKKIKLITGSLLTVFLLTITLVTTGSVNASTNKVSLTFNSNTLNLKENDQLLITDDDGFTEFINETDSSRISDHFTPSDNIRILVNGTGTVTLTGNEQGTVIITAGKEYNIENDDGTIRIAEVNNWDNAATFFSNPQGIVINVGAHTTSDNQRPAISGEENFVTNVDDAKPISFFQAFLKAIDETDGEVPVYVISDNYTANIRVLGTHKVVFGAKDSSGNEATLEAYIRVIDITKPIITGNASVVKIGYKEVWNITNFKTTLSVTDNYDTLTNADITVKTDGYTANKSKLGTYNVVYAVKDSSNNEGTFTKPVQVYDNVRPTFSGPTTISTSNTTILTESDVRAQITANDEIDGNLTNKIKLVEDNFTGKGNKVGSYTIKYSVTDNAGNTAEFIVTIQRSDKLPPVIWIQDGVSIKTTPTTPLTFEQIIAILQATGQVSGSTQTRFSLIYDEYTGNESTPGIYAMSINARSVDGNESLHNMSITVLDDTNDDGITTNPGFEIVTWIKENPALVTVGIVAVIGIGYFVFRKKK